MKQFNIAKNQQIVFGRIIPKNAIYGKFSLNWEHKTKVGFKVIKDKAGNTRFNKNGMPMIRNKYKIEQFHNSCIYCVESLETFNHTDAFCLGAYVLFENAKTWQYMHLGGTKFLNELNRFIAKNILEYSRSTGIEIIKIHTAIEEPCIGGNRINKPKRRNVPTEYIFRGYGYAIRSDIINEEITFDTHCSVASNLKKCHPIDERPIYSSKIKSKPAEEYVKYTRTIIMMDEKGETTKRVIQIKDDVCNNPANGGYIRNADGKVTTRDGKTVKTGF